MNCGAFTVCPQSYVLHMFVCLRGTDAIGGDTRKCWNKGILRNVAPSLNKVCHVRVWDAEYGKDTLPIKILICVTRSSGWLDRCLLNSSHISLSTPNIFGRVFTTRKKEGKKKNSEWIAVQSRQGCPWKHNFRLFPWTKTKLKNMTFSAVVRFGQRKTLFKNHITRDAIPLNVILSFESMHLKPEE